jgi:glycolate oxidase iron-sulfur subunit
MLATVLPYPGRFRVALALARLARGLEPLLRRIPALTSVAAMLALAPRRLPVAAPVSTVPAPGAKRGRVVLLQGCAEPVLKPQYREAAIRLLTRLGHEVVRARGEGCCGALVHHMGRKAESLESARRNVDAWIAEIEGEGVDAILVTASGCGTTIKDYGFMLRDDPAYAARAARVSALAKDIAEFLAGLDMPPPAHPPALTVAYHAACSLQHGQSITEAPKALLRQAGFSVLVPAESHLCCGSAGVYNILQPVLADAIGRRKADNLDRLNADVIATGNIGCATQIALKAEAPVVHTVELLDWAYGGPPPGALRGALQR